jgi:hypothetical protein
MINTMTTLTFNVPDKEADSIAQIINKKGGILFIKTKERLSKTEQHSLNRALDEAHKIKKGEMKALNFEDLWDE